MKKTAVKTNRVVNLTGGVETDDGRTLYGMDAETYLKMKEKEDPNWQIEILAWIETLLKEKLEPPNLNLCLKSGIVLCKMLNKLKPGIIPKFNLTTMKGGPIHALMEVENINLYLKACWKLGVPSTELFTTSDLHMGRGMQAVFANIASVSRLASGSLGYTGKPIGSQAPPKPVAAAKKWDPVPGKSHAVADLVDDEEDEPSDALSSSALKAELDALKKKCADLESSLVKVTEQRDSLQKSAAAASDRQAAVKTTTDKSAERISQLEKQVLDLSKTRDRLMESNMELTKTGQQLQAEIKALKAQAAQTSSEKVSTEARPARVEVNATASFGGQVSSTTSASVPAAQSLASPGADARTRGRSFVLDRAVVGFKRQIEQEEHTKASTTATELIYYEKKISDHLLYFAQETVRNLITSKEVRVELEDMSELTGLFKFDTGIRLFCFLLNLEIPKMSKKLSADAFQCLTFLVNQLLTEMYEANLKDFNSIAIVLKAATRFYMDGKNGNFFLQSVIRSHFIWQDLFLWEQYFWVTVSKKFKKSLDSNYVPDSPKEKKFLADELKLLGKFMMDWNQKLETVLHFVGNMSEMIELPADLLKSVTHDLEKQHQKNVKKAEKEKPKVTPPPKGDSSAKVASPK